MNKEGAMMIDYIVDIIFWSLLLSGVSFTFGVDYAERKQQEAYENWRLENSRQRMSRIRKEW